MIVNSKTKSFRTPLNLPFWNIPCCPEYCLSWHQSAGVFSFLFLTVDTTHLSPSLFFFFPFLICLRYATFSYQNSGAKRYKKTLVHIAIALDTHCYYLQLQLSKTFCSTVSPEKTIPAGYGAVFHAREMFMWFFLIILPSK